MSLHSTTSHSSIRVVPTLVSGALKARVKMPKLLNLVRSPQEVLHHFKDGQSVAWSGFTGVAGAKVVPWALADMVEKNGLQGKMSFDLYACASTDVHIESRWADLGMIKRRSPYQKGKAITDGINNGDIMFFDTHLSMWIQNMMYDYYMLDKPKNQMDVFVIEATGIKEDGSLVLGPAVGCNPEFATLADKIIVELNTAVPNLEGLHDITFQTAPPYREPIPLTRVDERIGSTSLSVDPSKIVAIVESKELDTVPANTPSDKTSKELASHLVDFLKQEVKMGRLPENLHPLQSGIGNIANAVVEGLAEGPFGDLTVWSEVIQESFLDFFETGKIKAASATSIRLTPEGSKKFYDNWEEYSKKLVLRSAVVSNQPEVIRRLGCIAMNTPVEVDVYGHVNSTCVNGSRMLNGLGGSNDFLRNSKLSIMHSPSIRPTKSDPLGISCVVPMATHVDSTEHDLDVFVTEQGLADLRGLAPRERARVIVDKCAHPVYKDILTEYLDRAEFWCTKRKSLHEPHILRDAFRLHTNLEDCGTMRIEKW